MSFKAAGVANQMLLATVAALVALPVVLLILRGVCRHPAGPAPDAAWDADC
jgi:hypothetical protein